MSNTAYNNYGLSRGKAMKDLLNLIINGDLKIMGGFSRIYEVLAPESITNKREPYSLRELAQEVSAKNPSMNELQSDYRGIQELIRLSKQAGFKHHTAMSERFTELKNSLERIL